jgi:hypothetical protein
MTASVSTNYRELTSGAEVLSVAASCAQAWQDPLIPYRQWEIVKPELDALRKGDACAPYAALQRCMSHLPIEFLRTRPTLLDVGASSGYYREVLQVSGYPVRYTGCDYSRTFQRLAISIYPDIDFDIADAASLPYHDDSFDIVLHSAVIMHMHLYAQAIQEAVRVAKRYIIFHRRD